MYEHSLIYGHVEFAVWGIGIRKDSLIFNQWMKDCLSIKRLFEPAYFGRGRRSGRKKKNSTEAFL